VSFRSPSDLLPCTPQNVGVYAPPLPHLQRALHNAVLPSVCLRLCERTSSGRCHHALRSPQGSGQTVEVTLRCTATKPDVTRHKFELTLKTPSYSGLVEAIRGKLAEQHVRITFEGTEQQWTVSEKPDIIVYTSSGDLVVPETPDVMELSVVFHAFELYTKVPMPLFRTVQLDRAHPAVASQAPDQGFTQRNPVFCAAFCTANGEHVVPTFQKTASGIEVHGVSLRVRYSTVKNDHPWRVADGQPTWSFCDPAVALPDPPALDADPFGILHHGKLYLAPDMLK
jgi:hypothetical protein